jgi:acetyl-CoA carboxylase carboxyl transferase subunit alpha
MKEVKQQEYMAWKQVEIARHPARPLFSDYLTNIFEDIIELHGDRCFSDDQAIWTGLAKCEGIKLLVVGHNKGKTTQERIKCNFGCAHPEGYRKAKEKMKLAEKFHLPIICFIDTPGAYPGIGAEERGQAFAIANNIWVMHGLRTPIIAVIIGEGGSGGALGIGVADRVLMLENSYYSVISPEGCSAILWKSANKYKEAAEALKLTASDLLKLKIIDEIIKEPEGGAHKNPQFTFQQVKQSLLNNLKILMSIPIEQLLVERYNKFRAIGFYKE